MLSIKLTVRKMTRFSLFYLGARIVLRILGVTAVVTFSHEDSSADRNAVVGSGRVGSVGLYMLGFMVKSYADERFRDCFSPVSSSSCSCCSFLSCCSCSERVFALLPGRPLFRIFCRRDERASGRLNRLNLMEVVLGLRKVGVIDHHALAKKDSSNISFQMYHSCLNHLLILGLFSGSSTPSAYLLLLDAVGWLLALRLGLLGLKELEEDEEAADLRLEEEFKRLRKRLPPRRLKNIFYNKLYYYFLNG